MLRTVVIYFAVAASSETRENLFGGRSRLFPPAHHRTGRLLTPAAVGELFNTDARTTVNNGFFWQWYDMLIVHFFLFILSQRYKLLRFYSLLRAVTSFFTVTHIIWVILFNAQSRYRSGWSIIFFCFNFWAYLTVTFQIINYKRNYIFSPFACQVSWKLTEPINWFLMSVSSKNIHYFQSYT